MDYDPIYDTIPKVLRPGIYTYMMSGEPVGDFLTACFANDLMHAIGFADPGSLAAIKAITTLIYNQMPMKSHGSREAVALWKRAGGFRGTSPHMDGLPPDWQLGSDWQLKGP